MPNKKLRLGIIGANVGYGWTPRAHAPAIAELTDIDLVAVCTAHEETAKESAEKVLCPPVLAHRPSAKENRRRK